MKNHPLSLSARVLFAFAFSLFSMVLYAQSTISCSQSTSANLTNSSPVNTFLLSANNNDRVRIRAYSFVAGLNLRIEVRSPDNSVSLGVFFANNGLVDIQELTLGAGNGQYRILVSDAESNTTGTYNISVQGLNKTTCASLVSCSASSSGSYFYSAAIEGKYLVASAGDVLRLRFYFNDPNPEWRLEVRRPDGTLHALLAKNGSGLIDTTMLLPAAGNWFFYLYDEDGDEANTTHNYNYAFQILNKTTCSSQVSCSASSSGSYFYSAAIEGKYLVASAGDVLRLRYFFVDPNPEWRLEVRRPDGTLHALLAQNGSGLIDTTMLLPTGGNWFFYLYDEDGDEANTTHNYNYAFQILNKTTCSSQVSCNASSSGSYYYSAAIEGKYLAATAGDVLRLRYFFVDPNPEWRLEVRRPDGTLHALLAKNGSGLIDTTMLLPAAGNWFFYLYDEDGDEANTTHNYNYAFQILNKTTCASQVSCSASSSGSYYYSAAIEGKYLAATAGDVLRLRYFFVDPNPEWRLEVRRPDGTLHALLAKNGSGLIDTTMLLPTGGNWFFYLYDEDGDEANATHNYNYAFQILNKTTCASQVSCNESSSGSYYYSAAIEGKYLAATAGDVLRLRYFFVDPNPEWRLEVRRPDGTLHALLAQNGSGLIDATMLLPVGGNWFFYLYDEDGDEANTTHNYNYAFQILNKTTCASQVSCNESSSDSYYYSAAIEGKYLVASAGDVLRLRFYFNDPNPEWRLEVRRPDGTLHALLAKNGSGLIDATMLLPVGGNWFFYLYDEDGDEANTTHNYNYAFQILNKTTCASQVSCNESSSDSYYYSAAIEGKYLVASAGDVLRLRFYFNDPNPEWRLEVRRPDGTLHALLAKNGSGLIDTTILLPAAGNWFFYLYDEDGDEANTTHNYNYAFQILNKTTCSSQVSCNESSSDSYYYSAAIEGKYLVASAGDVLRLRFYFNDPNPEWRLEVRRPDGTLHALLAKNGSGLIDTTILLPAAGNWFFYLYDEDGDEANTTRTYHYSFRLLKTSCATALNCGGSVSGSILYRPEIDLHYFYAEPCDTARLLFSAVDPSFYEAISLYAPNGALIGQYEAVNSSDPAILQVPLSAYGYGYYLVAVYEKEGNSLTFTNYTLSLSCLRSSLNVAPASMNINALGGNQTLNVSGPCPSWSIAGSANWATANPNTGSGSGPVVVTFGPNQTTASRSAQLLLVGCCDSTFVNLFQSGATLSVSPSSINAGIAGGAYSVNVTSTCIQWAVSSSQDWATPSVSSGSGSQSLSIMCSSNTTGLGRNAVITFSGCGINVTINVVQPAATLACTPGNINPTGAGGDYNVTLSTNCPLNWISSVAPSAGSWIEVLPVFGNGSGNVVIRVSPNDAPIARSGTVEFSACDLTRSISVVQSGATLNATPLNFTISGSAAGSVVCNLSGTCHNWNITGAPDWLTVSLSGNALPATATLLYTANNSGVTRTATLTLSGCGITRSITVTQPGVLIISGSTSYCQGSSTQLCAPTADAYLWSNGATTRCIIVSTPGLYNVVITQGGTQQSGSVTILELPAPFPPFIVQFDANVLLAVGDASSWRWYLNGQLIAGANGNSLPFTAGGSYTVTAVGANGCESQPSVPFLITSVHEPAKAGRLKVTPNPCSEWFEAEIPDRVISARCLVFDAYGRLCFDKKEVTGQVVRVPRNGLPAGWYLIQIIDNRGTVSATGKVLFVDY